MIEYQQCKSCGQKDSCRVAYEQMSKYKGPSVLGKVFGAFVLPLAVFIISLILFDKFAASAIRGDKLKILLNLGIATTLTFASIMAIQFVNRKFRENRKQKLCKP